MAEQEEMTTLVVPNPLSSAPPPTLAPVGDSAGDSDEPAAAAAAREAVESVHTKVVCDDCRTTPLRGIRWRCMFCVGFDLCDACHTAARTVKSHRPEHHMTLQMPVAPKSKTTNTLLFYSHASPDTLWQCLSSWNRVSCFPTTYPRPADRFESLLSAEEYASAIDRINSVYQRTLLWRLRTLLAPTANVANFVVTPLAVGLTAYSALWVPVTVLCFVSHGNVWAHPRDVFHRKS